MAWNTTWRGQVARDRRRGGGARAAARSARASGAAARRRQWHSRKVLKSGGRGGSSGSTCARAGQVIARRGDGSRRKHRQGDDFRHGGRHDAGATASRAGARQPVPDARGGGVVSGHRRGELPGAAQGHSPARDQAAGGGAQRGDRRRVPPDSWEANDTLCISMGMARGSEWSTLDADRSATAGVVAHRDHSGRLG